MVRVDPVRRWERRGMSVFGFMRAFPDNQSCVDHLFRVRGGHLLPCRTCGQQTTWTAVAGTTKFRSSCCAARVNSTSGTLFYLSVRSLWLWFYTLVFLFNLSAFPSADFLARHLGVDQNTAWRTLKRIREQLAVICGRASTCLRGEVVAIENFRFNNTLSARQRQTNAAHVLVVATECEAFAFVMPRLHPAYYRALLDQLGVSKQLYVDDYDSRFAAHLARFTGYEVHRRSEPGHSEQVLKKFANAKSLGRYLRAVVAKRHAKLNKATLHLYLAELVFRFNLSQEKSMFFPLFLMSLGRIAGFDHTPTEEVFRLDRDVPRRLPR